MAVADVFEPYSATWLDMRRRYQRRSYAGLVDGSVGFPEQRNVGHEPEMVGHRARSLLGTLLADRVGNPSVTVERGPRSVLL